MRFFIVLVVPIFIVSTALGFWWGHRTVGPLREQALIKRSIQLSERDANGQRWFQYVCYGKAIRTRPVVPDIAIDLTPFSQSTQDRGLISPLLKDYQGLMGGAAAGGIVTLNLATASKMAKQAVSTAGQEKTRGLTRVLAVLGASITGALLGYEVSLIGQPCCDDPEIMYKLRDHNTWEPAIRDIEYETAEQGIEELKAAKDKAVYARLRPALVQFIADYNSRRITSRDFDGMLSSGAVIIPNISHGNEPNWVLVISTVIAFAWFGLLAAWVGVAKVIEIIH